MSEETKQIWLGRKLNREEMEVFGGKWLLTKTNKRVDNEAKQEAEITQMRGAIEETIAFLAIEWQPDSPDGFRVYNKDLCKKMLEKLQIAIGHKEGN